MKQVDFNDGKISKSIARTAFPMLVAQMINLLYSIVDRIYIGRIPETGTTALGAVGLCFPIIILITGFTNMYGMGGSPLFAMELGRENRDKAESIMNTAFRLLITTAAVIMLFGELFAEPLLILFGASDSTMSYALGYLRIYLLGTAFSMLSTGMNPYVNAQGFPGLGMISVVIGALANLILDPIFIFALGMGVNGAATATVISQCLSAVFILSFLFGKRLQYHVRRYNGRRISESFPYAKDIVSLGTAPFIMQCTNALVKIVCNNMLMLYGGDVYVSVMTIISSVREILDTPVSSVTEGSSPIISFNYGARRPARVRKAIAIMTGTAITYTLAVWVLIERYPAMLISIFSSDESLLEPATTALHLYFYAFVFQAFQYSGQTVFKALGKKKQAVFFSLFRKVVMVVPLTCILPSLWNLGTDGVFMAEPISNVIGGLACFITMLLTVLPELKRMDKKPVNTDEDVSGRGAAK